MNDKGSVYAKDIKRRYIEDIVENIKINPKNNYGQRSTASITYSIGVRDDPGVLDSEYRLQIETAKEELAKHIYHKISDPIIADIRDQIRFLRDISGSLIEDGNKYEKIALIDELQSHSSLMLKRLGVG
jgi:hypothetical protein